MDLHTHIHEEIQPIRLSLDGEIEPIDKESVISPLNIGSYMYRSKGILEPILVNKTAVSIVLYFSPFIFQFMSIYILMFGEIIMKPYSFQSSLRWRSALRHMSSFSWSGT